MIASRFSHNHLIDSASHPPLTVIMHLSVEGQADRMRNAGAALIALNDQNIRREQYRIILVEQGTHPVSSGSCLFGRMNIFSLLMLGLITGPGLSMSARAKPEREYCASLTPT
jgi:hypothetical protein